MPITFRPQGGDVLLCDFGPDPAAPATYPLAAGPVSMPPEMVKARHVVVLAAGHLITVAPFSTREPDPIRPFHQRIAAGTYPFFRGNEDSWLKGDVIQSVSPARLDRLYFDGRHQRARLSPADWAAVRRAVLHGIGLGQLHVHV